MRGLLFPDKAHCIVRGFSIDEVCSFCYLSNGVHEVSLKKERSLLRGKSGIQQ